MTGLDAEGRPAYHETSGEPLACRVGRPTVAEREIAARMGEEFGLVVLVPPGTPVVLGDELNLSDCDDALAGRWHVVTVTPLPRHLRVLCRRFDV